MIELTSNFGRIMMFVKYSVNNYMLYLPIYFYRNCSHEGSGGVSGNSGPANEYCK